MISLAGTGSKVGRRGNPVTVQSYRPEPKTGEAGPGKSPQGKPQSILALGCLWGSMRLLKLRSPDFQATHT